MIAEEIAVAAETLARLTRERSRWAHDRIETAVADGVADAFEAFAAAIRREDGLT